MTFPLAATAGYAQSAASGIPISGVGSAIKALNDMLSHTLRREVVAGAIIVLHPFYVLLGASPDNWSDARRIHRPWFHSNMIRVVMRCIYG
jgi:hypothetical protein